MNRSARHLLMVSRAVIQYRTEGEIRSLVKEADVQIYAIGLFDSTRGPKRRDQGRSFNAQDRITLS